MVASEQSPPMDIELVGVSTNNLKGIDVRFPLGAITVVTGVSGSGKSSLVFDSLYGEAYRRYVESLSSFARQYLKALPKPDVKEVRNLPPAIAVRQTRSGATNRSTVGTLTELWDVLRILFAHLSEPWCCGRPVRRDHPDGIAKRALELYRGERVLVMGSLVRWTKESGGKRLPAKELKAALEAQGFTRLFVRGEVVRLTEAKASDLAEACVVVDRVKAEEASERRLADAAALALKVGRGDAVIAADGKKGASRFTNRLDCPECGTEYLEPTPALFSFNHPLGACEECQGFGSVAVPDWEKIIPDKDASLESRGVAPWNFGRHGAFYRLAKVSAKARDFDPKTRFADYDDEDWQWLVSGDGRRFHGIEGYFEYLDSKKYKPHYRIHAARYRKYVKCPSCEGARLNRKALACRIDGKNLAEVGALSLAELANWVSSLAASHHPERREAGSMGAAEALEEGVARLGYLVKIGVGYLTLGRSARTLSGGELQRINMARSLGSALTETLFCLDEPTAGLHARDSGNLMAVVRELKAQGNTVVMVEHERRVMVEADHLIEIGPSAGHEGGEVVYAGPPSAASFARVALPRKRSEKKDEHFLTLKGARTHNLKNVDVKIPTGAMTAVCGVSGSGKTSLIQHTFYPAAARLLGQEIERGGDSEPLYDELSPASLVKGFAEVMLVSQAPLGRSSRSNIATYLGMMDEIRKLLAQEPRAKKLKLTPGSFSFNTPGGRCETCKGLGTVVEDLSFLGEMEVICPACEGRRFSDDVLSVDYRGRNLLDILKMTLAEARTFFFENESLRATCDVILNMGLGYLTLGQHTSSFSGGEAQRLKLIGLLRAVKVARPSLLIFDEPTTGLSDRDVAYLLEQFRELTRKGHTIVVVEHHLGVLEAADWLIEVGPEAAAAGGEIVYQGPPEGLPGTPRSVTGPYLFQEGKQ